MTQSLWGVDVGKAELVVVGNQGDPAVTLRNQPAEIRRWLKALPAAAVLAMESTGDYHRCLADLAVAMGLTVYVISPRALRHYREAVSQRAKTDRCDAELILRFVEREREKLRPYQPLSAEHRRWRSLLRRRSRLVAARVSLRQSLAGLPELHRQLGQIVARINGLIARIDEMIENIASTGQQRVEQRRALQSIVGVGPLTSAGLLSVLEVGDFGTADAFVAFLGLDPRPRDSSTLRGVRRLSKQGDGELRRLLFVAALSASRTKLWQPLYQHYRRRWSTVESCIILARKIARIAWALFRQRTTFNPDLVHAPA